MKFITNAIWGNECGRTHLLEILGLKRDRCYHLHIAHSLTSLIFAIGLDCCPLCSSKHVLKSQPDMIYQPIACV